MIVKELKFKGDARDKLISGIEKMASAVKCTLGARGKTVLIESENVIGGITVTKDGVTVARSITLEDPIENAAVVLLRQAAENTAKNAGDGTSTSVVLTEALVKSATELMTSEHNSSEVVRCLQNYKDQVVNFLDKKSIRVSKSKLHDIATISSNGDKEIGKLISKTYSEVGSNGVVLVENSTSNDTYSDIIDGMRIQRGWTSKYFVTDEKRSECVLNDAYVLVTDQEITNLMSLEHIFAECIKRNKPLLIIGELSSNALATLNMNVLRKTIKACNILPPHFGYKRKDLLQDLSVALGAKYFSDGTGDDMQLIRFEDLGRVKKAVVGQETTSLVNYDSEELNILLAELKSRLDSVTKKTEIEFLKERIANITGSIGIINVGADSDIELKEKRDRIDDAVCAVQAAIEQGVLPGGGVALLRAISELDVIPTKNGEVAFKIMLNALESPIRQIILNAGLDSDGIVNTLVTSNTNFNMGFDVKMECYCDMLETGIIDPSKVTKQAIINSVSVATTIMSTDATITNIRQ